MTKLLEHEQILKDLSYDAEIEHRESRKAYKSKAGLFAVDSKHLTIIHNVAKFTWDDDARLRELGFCPSSEIWTLGQPEPGTPGEPEEPEEPEEPTIPWEEGAHIDAVCVGLLTWDLKVIEMCVGMTDGTWELKMEPEGLWQLVTDHVTIEEWIVIAHRLFDMPPGDFMARFTPRNAAEESGTTTEVGFTVEDE